ncbi:MAG: hypothetical protein V3U88_13125 [Methylococcales bacterium]
MSINSLGIINKLLPVFLKKRVSEVKNSVSSDEDSDDHREQNPATQTDNTETAVSEPDSSVRLSSQALLSVFRKSECCTLDGLNEYDDDFTSFVPLGNLVTHEMKQAADQLTKRALQDPNNENSHTLEIDEITAQNNSGENL